MTDRVAQLVLMAKEIASADPDFQSVKGPGKGDHATNHFLHLLQNRAEAVFGIDLSEKKICGMTSYAVDFYFPDEATIVEVALGLPNTSSEYEKDILKAIIAQEHTRVERLLLISRPGGAKKCRQPGRLSLKEWALRKHQLTVEVEDLEGVARKRSGRRLLQRMEATQYLDSPAI